MSTEAPIKVLAITDPLSPSTMMCSNQHIPVMMQWYYKDFGATKEVAARRFINGIGTRDGKVGERVAVSHPVCRICSELKPRHFLTSPPPPLGLGLIGNRQLDNALTLTRHSSSSLSPIRGKARCSLFTRLSEGSSRLDQAFFGLRRCWLIFCWFCFGFLLLGVLGHSKRREARGDACEDEARRRWAVRPRAGGRRGDGAS